MSKEVCKKLPPLRKKFPLTIDFNTDMDVLKIKLYFKHIVVQTY